MTTHHFSELDWRIRLSIYRFFVDHERPPTFQETAQQFGIPTEQARETYHRLHDAHMLFLDPGTDAIRMAHPLSAIPTPFRVHIEGHTLWANCAWDALGIPAMLHSDAHIEAEYSYPREPVTLTIENNTLRTQQGLVHFALPFSRWYDDLIHT